MTPTLTPTLTPAPIQTPTPTLTLTLTLTLSLTCCRPHFGLVLSRVVLVGLIDEAIMSPAGYHPHQHAP